MRTIILCTVAVMSFGGIAHGQVHSQSVLGLTRASVEARSAVQRLATARPEGTQALVQEILIVADTTAGTEYFLFTQPGDNDLTGVNRSAVRFTPGFDGHIIYVGYVLAAGAANPRGTGKLRISLAGTRDDSGWITPVGAVDSADVDFGDLRAGDINYLMTLSDPDWEVREAEDFFIAFEAIPDSDISRIDLIVDDGSTDPADDRYFPARTVLYGDFPPPNDGWLYRFENRNNLVVAVAIANLLAPDLMAPADSSEGLDDEVSLLWTTARRSTSYRVQITSDRTFENIELSHVTTDTTHALDGLAPSTRYWWRVRAENDLGEGPWSRASWFETSLTASVEQPGAVAQPRLVVFPNPARENARIALHLYQTGPVRIEAFDVLGRLVDVIYEGTLTRGEHTLEWNADRQATGALFVRAEIGAHSIVRTLIRP